MRAIFVCQLFPLTSLLLLVLALLSVLHPLSFRLPARPLLSVPAPLPLMLLGLVFVFLRTPSKPCRTGCRHWSRLWPPCHSRLVHSRRPWLPRLMPWRSRRRNGGRCLWRWPISSGRYRRFAGKRRRSECGRLRCCFFPCLLSASLVYRMNLYYYCFFLKTVPILMTFLSRLFPLRGAMLLELRVCAGTACESPPLPP